MQKKWVEDCIENIYLYICIYYIYNKCLGLWPMQTSVG